MPSFCLLTQVARFIFLKARAEKLFQIQRFYNEFGILGHLQKLNIKTK